MGASVQPAGGRNRRKRHQVMNEINVTPFVDVMLVLLIVFMVAAPLLTVGVQVNLPETSAQTINQPDEPLIISVNAQGDIFIQESKTEAAQLIAALQAIVGEKQDTVIYVRGDRDISYGAVMRVMGQVNAAGFTKVALITEALQE